VHQPPLAPPLPGIATSSAISTWASSRTSRVPTLVLNVRASPFVPLEQGRFMAQRIPRRDFLELPGGQVGVSPSIYLVGYEIAESSLQNAAWLTSSALLPRWYSPTSRRRLSGRPRSGASAGESFLTPRTECRGQLRRLTCGSDIPVRARCGEKIWADWPSTSPPGCVGCRGRVKSSSQAPSRTWLQGRGSNSPSAVSTS
jgi:hypothetical protein